MGLSKVISALSGAISAVTLIITLVTKSHDPLSRVLRHGSSFGLECIGWLWSGWEFSLG